MVALLSITSSRPRWAARDAPTRAEGHLPAGVTPGSGRDLAQQLRRFPPRSWARGSAAQLAPHLAGDLQILASGHDDAARRRTQRGDVDVSLHRGVARRVDR